MPKLTAHPSREELSAYSLGQLPEERAVSIDTHISQCEPCCETIVELSSEDTFAGLLQEAGRLPTDLTLDSDSSTAKSSSTSEDIPAPLAEHPRYEIVRLIGKGGMGDVYEARHRMMERTVALKVIKQELMRKPEAVDRFHREVKAAAQLAHPNVVTAYDAEQAGDIHYMVMEFVDGVDLSQMVKDRGALPVADACAYICQAAIGLQHAHERGMVHRDIKPHNLMVTADGTVKILDFGLASLAPKAIADADTVEARGDLTAAGAIMGTPDFISPEQADDARKADIRSDIYSLGATLYFLLAGRPPFAEGSVTQKLKSHAQAEPKPLKSLRDDVPPELVAIVTKMTAKDPERRFQTPVAVAEALKSFSQSAPMEIVELPTQAKPRRWKPTFLSLTAVAALFVVAIFAGLIYYVQTNHGVVRVEVTDPSLEVSIKDHTITMKDGDGKPLTIRPGEQSLIVRNDDADFEFETDSFQIRRGDKIAFKVDYVIGEVVVTKDGERFHSQALSDDIEVQKILDRMARAYAECKSYRDSGVIKTVIVENADSPQITFEHSLTTVFERPDRFRFEIKDQYDDKLLISLDGQDIQTSWDIEPGFQKPESLELAMAQAVGFTGGDVGRIPAMLMPKKLDGWVDLDLIAPRQIEDGKLQNVECFRLEYNFRDEQIILWIDKQSHLVRRIDERIESDGIRISERTTTYDPTIDGKITDQMLEFDPPAPRAADADTHKAGQQRSDNQFDMPLCWCPAGEFKMGREQLPVTLTRGFWMGKYEVTQAQYEALMGENPSENKGEALPVEKVAWNEAKKFCQKFTELERKAGRLPKGWEYRLPTEAQWEYACRAGTTLVWDDEKALVYPSTFGDDLSELGDYAWYSANSDGTPHPGGQKKPNAWGLCDMYGNVREWVRDAWQSKLSGGKDPEVDVWSPIHARRGGDWLSYAEPCGSPFIRGFGTAGLEVHMMGFRVALVPVSDSGDGAAADGDHTQLQGEWETESLIESGKTLAAEDGFGSLLLHIKGNTFAITERKPNGEKSEVDTGRIDINSTTTPKTIDFIGRDQSTIGIYELKDRVLRVCLVEQDGTDAPAGERIPDTKHLKRPTTFDSPAGINVMLMEFRRTSDNTRKVVTRRADVLGMGKVVSFVPQESDELATIELNKSEPAVELWVSGDDAKLVQEGDRVRLEFEGWPAAEPSDFFGGKVISLDPTADGAGMFRVLIKGGDSESWPDKRYLRPGVRANCWIFTAAQNPAQQSEARSSKPTVEEEASAPAGDVPAKENDIPNIQGTWQVTYSEDGGRIAPQEMLKEIRFGIDEQNLTTEIGGRKSISTYKLDPSTNPKSIDLTENGRTKQAIYDLAGDTLRICIAESGEQRPTAFDSQPNSANDIVLILKRVKPDNASADGTKDQNHNGPLSEELARSLIPAAASISNEDFQKLQTNPAAQTIKNKSLSLVLMTLDLGDQSTAAANDFRFLVEGYPKPSEIAAAMSPSRSKGYFSIIQPEYITECKITNSTNEIAQGKVTFNGPMLYIGSAIFEARKHEGTWRIEKFHLPSRQISIELGEDGNWHPEGKKAEGNHAPDPSDSIPDETPESSISNAADIRSLPLVEIFDTTYINKDTVGLLVAHPQRILTRKSKVKEGFDQMFAKVAKSEGLDIRNLRQVVAQLGPPPLSSRPISNFFDEQIWTLILRFDEPVDVTSYIDNHASGYTKAEHKGETYYQHDSRVEMWFPDDRTLVCAAERRILSLIDEPEGKGPMAARMGRADAADDLVLEFDVRQAGPLLLESLPAEAQDPEVYPVIEQAIQQLRRITLTAKQTSDTPILARFQAIDAETARALHDQASVLLETAKREWPELRESIRERPADKNTKLASAFADEVDSLPPAIRLTVDEDQLLIRVEKEGGVDLADLLVFFMLID